MDSLRKALVDTVPAEGGAHWTRLAAALVLGVVAVRAAATRRTSAMSASTTRPLNKHYDLDDVKSPVLKGSALHFFAKVLMTRLRHLILPKLAADAGLPELVETEVPHPPTFFPHPPERFAAEQANSEPVTGEELRELLDREADANAAKPADSFRFPSIRDYTDAYRSGRTTPLAVAERFLSAVRESNAMEKPLRAFIFVNEDDVLEQARQSAARYASGDPKGLLDGILVGVKDELDVGGYRTWLGTQVLGKPAELTTDCNLVRKLRRHGAIICGKTNMHELGISVTGCNGNPQHGTCRNPYNLDFDTSGSSSGSAVAVASGLTPVSIGADGGGSIRLPAAFNGCVGLKANFGRITSAGSPDLDPPTAHAGAIAGNARDAALVYALLAGRDPEDEHSMLQPAPSVRDFDNVRSLQGVRIGVFRKWNEHAHPDVVSAYEATLKTLCDMGAEPVDIDFGGMKIIQMAHVVIIVSAMLASIEHDVGDDLSKFTPTTIVMLQLAQTFTATMLYNAMKVRTHAMREGERAFERCDVILTPATACLVPRYPESFDQCESNLNKTAEVMRFAYMFNMTGSPAVTFPVSYDDNKCPISMQIVAPYWREDLCLRFAEIAETKFTRQKPSTFYDLLSQSQS